MAEDTDSGRSRRLFHHARRSTRRRLTSRGARGRHDQRAGRTRDRRDGLHVFLFPRHNGRHAKAADQRRQGRGHQRADEHVRQPCRIPDGGHEGRGPAEFRHAVFQRLARPDQGADDRLGPRHARALLSAADARHVDRRVRLAGLAHHRNPGRRLCRGAAGLERLVAGGRGSHRRAHALCLDHRPHQDRWSGRLRGRAQDPGRLQDHAAVALGQGRRAGGRHRRSRRRHEDAAEDHGRYDAGRQVLRLRRRDPQAAAAAHHRSADPRPDAADRDRAGQELRHRQGRSGDQGRAGDRARGCLEADGVEGRQPCPRRRTAGR